jgi:hypothetical protein
MQRMGATGGGVWGNGFSRELLREPLHLSSVVSGSVAQKHQKAQQRQQRQQQRRLQQLQQQSAQQVPQVQISRSQQTSRQQQEEEQHSDQFPQNPQGSSRQLPYSQASEQEPLPSPLSKPSLPRHAHSEGLGAIAEVPMGGEACADPGVGDAHTVAAVGTQQGGSVPEHPASLFSKTTTLSLDELLDNRPSR